MNARDLIKDWIAFAKKHGIRAAGSAGRQPTVGDVTTFMVDNGFDQKTLDSILDQMETSPTTQQSDVVTDEPGEDNWWDQDTAPSAYDPEYDIEDEDTTPGDVSGSDVAGSDESEPETVSGDSGENVRDLEAEPSDEVDPEVKAQELGSAKRIIKKLSRAQQRQLYRELKHV